jgi:hypothetical protein
MEPSAQSVGGIMDDFTLSQIRRMWYIFPQGFEKLFSLIFLFSQLLSFWF